MYVGCLVADEGAVGVEEEMLVGEDRLSIVGLELRLSHGWKRMIASL